MRVQYIQEKTNCKLVHLLWLKLSTKIWHTRTHTQHTRNLGNRPQQFMHNIYSKFIFMLFLWKVFKSFCAVLRCSVVCNSFATCTVHIILNEISKVIAIIFWMKIFYIPRRRRRRHVISKPDQTIQTIAIIVLCHSSWK